LIVLEKYEFAENAVICVAFVVVTVTHPAFEAYVVIVVATYDGSNFSGN
jgi:hypothetical protein